MLEQHCIKILSSQCCSNTSEITLHKEITCAMLDQSVQIYFRRNPAVSNISGSLFFNWIQYPTKQSWLFLFNVGSGVYLRFAGQQQTVADFDWNINFLCEFYMWIFWKVFCLPFLLNQAVWFISRGIGFSCFSGNFLLSFLLWYDIKILVKLRGGSAFWCLLSSVNVRQK